MTTEHDLKRAKKKIFLKLIYMYLANGKQFPMWKFQRTIKPLFCISVPTSIPFPKNGFQNYSVQASKLLSFIDSATNEGVFILFLLTNSIVQ